MFTSINEWSLFKRNSNNQAPAVVQPANEVIPYAADLEKLDPNTWEYDEYGVMQMDRDEDQPATLYLNNASEASIGIYCLDGEWFAHAENPYGDSDVFEIPDFQTGIDGIKQLLKLSDVQFYNPVKQLPESATTENPSDKILNKITKAICKTITSKMGGKITKEMDLKDMVLDYMGANGYGEDKKVASQVVKMVKADFKAKKINEDRYTNMMEEERYYKGQLAKITSFPAKVKFTDFDGNQTNFMNVSADNCEIFIEWFKQFRH